MVPQLTELSLELNLRVAYHFGKWNAATPIRRKTRRLSAWFMWERSSSFIKIYVTLTLAGVLFLLSRVLSNISSLWIYMHIYKVVDVTLLYLLCSPIQCLVSVWFSFHLGKGAIYFFRICYSFELPFNYFYNATKMWYNDYSIN